MKYNVKIKGYSIGITDSILEAIDWLSRSESPTQDKVIYIMSTPKNL